MQLNRYTRSQLVTSLISHCKEAGLDQTLDDGLHSSDKVAVLADFLLQFGDLLSHLVSEKAVLRAGRLVATWLRK